MATWAKENVPLIPIRNQTTGSTDSTSHTVKLQPKNETYDSGAITCSQCTTEQWLWKPDSDLDSEQDYYIYVDTVIKGSLNAREGVSNILGGD